MKTNIETKIKEKARKLAEIKQRNGLEQAYYQHLCDLIELIGNDELGFSIKANPCPTKIKAGYPDIEILNKDGLKIGYVEVKKPGDDLSRPEYENQFNNYKNNLPNVIFTNINSWELWQEDKKESKIIKNSNWNFQKIPNDYEGLKQLLQLFLGVNPIGETTPETLAKVLAKRTKLLAETVFEAFENDCPENLKMLYETIQDFLINDIKPRQFASMYAETITYALFIARLQQYKNEPDSQFNSLEAIDYLNKRLPEVPLLNELYSKARSPSLEIIRKQIDLIIQELKLCDIQKIEDSFIKHDPDKDPVIYFYEPFVKYTDKETKKQRGVFYTDKRIADFIVRNVNDILKNIFKLEDGLANENVHLLDPAAGTGTFLYSAIREIYIDLEQKYKKQGEEFIQQKMQKIIREHILDKFYGFEILMAPYAISHLKLSLLFEEYGYKFKNSDKNKRLKVYLTNTLENENNEKLSKAYDSITKENEYAHEVKNKKPVLAIIGNPPYSVSSMNKSKWIEKLVSDYKKGLKGNIQPLSDDYIKFIRFSQWKIEKTGHGIFAMITNNSFLDGIIHRQMRKSLLEGFDEIYIYDLHGNSKKKETTPEGNKDENVFDIMQGVSINIFIKTTDSKKDAAIYHVDSYGDRESKFKKLVKENLKTAGYKILKPEAPYYFFVPKDFKEKIKYEEGFAINELFKLNGSGIKFRKDNLLVKRNFTSDNVQGMLKDMSILDGNEILTKYNIGETPDWLIKDKWQYFKNWNKSDIRKIQYRPFDLRYSYYPFDKINKIIPRGDSRLSLMKHMIDRDNIGLATCKQQSSFPFQHILVSKTPIDMCVISSQTKETGYLFPLYLYPEDITSQAFKGKSFLRIPNFNMKIVEDIAKKLGITFTNEKKQKDNTFCPEDILYYIYAVLHAPSYRQKYKEFLKIDFPRIPFKSDKTIFFKLISFGKKLTNLHLFSENPFDSSKTILDDPKKWNVRIGREKASGLENNKVEKIKYVETNKRIYINSGQYFEGIEKNVWEFMVGGYQVCSKWLSARKGRILSHEEIEHYIKTIVALRETIKLMNEIDPIVSKIIDENNANNGNKTKKEKMNLKITIIPVKQKINN